MQLQVKPRLYAEVNKQMDESYYNYEAYEIEYGYIICKLDKSTNIKSSQKLVRVNTLRSILECALKMTAI